ncbi:DUF6707 family protein [Arthrobacter castelli]|uniref:DUF6707 family protein n=1 Tax=Arthrobacter castelli TaxID=271431 RepID=UPI000419E7CF|nr:DUF6707 family protein [Arthrobacter castelli]
MTGSEQPESPAGAAGAVIPPAPKRRPAPSGTAEAVVAQAAQAHPNHAALQRIAKRLSKGLNAKSGSSLSDVKDMAQLLFIDLGDSTNAMPVCQLITELPYDGAHGRWIGIEGCLAIASYIAAENGEEKLSADYAHKLRAPDRESMDDFRDKINARVRQRQLNEPNLYDREIARAAAAVDKKTELDWRKLRVQSLLYLLAHEGSETYSGEELERLTSNELGAIRTLVGDGK